MEDSDKFMKGQIVWAKASYYPWWPAQVLFSLNIDSKDQSKWQPYSL